MAKTYPWSTIVPAGSEQASTADDHIRRLRLEIEERMNDIVEDWSADPVALKPFSVGGAAGGKLIVHSSAFIVEPSEDQMAEYGDDNLQVASGTNPMRAALQLVPGLVINKMRAIVTHNGGGSDVIVSLKSLQFSTALATSTICQLQTATDGVQMLDSATLAPFTHTVTADECLFLVFDISAVLARLHCVELTFAESEE
jgi:hypothetical protein